jgi:aspartate aminotransferase-like enzyme
MNDTVLTMIPGPTPVQESILDELAKPTISHVAPSFVETTRACLDNLKRIVFTESARPFVVAGAGTLAMEMALVNLVAPDEKVLVVSQGFFGDRWAQLAEAFGIPYQLLQSEWGRVVPPDALAQRLDQGSYAAVTMTHVDTSTGAAAPVREYCELLRGRDTLSIVDGVCATAGMEERFDEWGMDVLLTGAQKAFGAPPGVAMLLVSERAMEKRRSRERVPAYYADLLRWLPIMDEPSKYFSTPAVNEVTALREATEIILREGLEARFARHATIGRKVRDGLGELGLTPFTDPSCLADTLTVATYPDGVEDATFRSRMAERKVVVAPALGPIAGGACRIGHMGNIGDAEIGRLLDAVGQSLGS